ncbi:MAG: Fic family protein [Verrucomicrobia bacterium]|nr:MAG: Fic family protein [Verrucomicrobiota bacterium]
MKIPAIPPNWHDILDKLFEENPETLRTIVFNQVPTYKGEYIHWDKLRRLDPPCSLTHEHWWLSLKQARRQQSKTIQTFSCVKGDSYCFTLPDPIPELLHHIDQNAGGRIEMPEEGLTNPQTRNRYLLHSLTEEAITSSQLEGATTTRKDAKEMLRENRAPKDISEQMILNNYRTMQFIREIKDQPLTPELVFEIHRTVTEDAMENPDDAGRFRASDNVRVYENMSDEVVHTPPPYKELPNRLEAMCDFANGKTPEYFVSPVVRAIILHFWLAYDHPFADGNGRCARALFYWSMLQHKYWLCEFISISSIIKKAPAKYGRAFLHTETDENDLTYFIIYHLEVIQKAIKELHKYIAEKTKSVRLTESILRQSSIRLNHRQISLLSHALRNPDAEYTIKAYQNTHDVVYQTARADLYYLEENGLLIKRRVGHSFSYFPAEQIDKKLKSSF